MELAKGKYQGVNDRHLMEKLEEEEKLEISVRKCVRSFALMGSFHRERGALTNTEAEERDERPRG